MLVSCHKRLIGSQFGVFLTFCVAAFSSSEKSASVLGVFDIQLYQVFLLQVHEVLHRLVAI